MHVPKENNTLTCTSMVPIAACNPNEDWLCDRCLQAQQPTTPTTSQPASAFCLLCNEDISLSLAKLTECILNDNDRTWCHFSCARWHEEVRIESKKRFLFTDKNALRQNEEKVMNDCFICDDASKRELLVKCLDCANYVHPTCLTTKTTLDTYQLFFNLAKGKCGYSCGCSTERLFTKKTLSLVDKNEIDNKPSTIEWVLVEFGIDELNLRALVQHMKEQDRSLICEVCAQVLLISVNSTKLSTLIQICASCFTVCHKKCNMQSTCGIKDFKCQACQKSKKSKHEM